MARRQVVHGDANDYNVLVAAEATEWNQNGAEDARGIGVVDFGDMVCSIILLTTLAFGKCSWDLVDAVAAVWVGLPVKTPRPTTGRDSARL